KERRLDSEAGREVELALSVLRENRHFLRADQIDDDFLDCVQDEFAVDAAVQLIRRDVQIRKVGGLLFDLVIPLQILVVLVLDDLVLRLQTLQLGDRLPGVHLQLALFGLQRRRQGAQSLVFAKQRLRVVRQLQTGAFNVRTALLVGVHWATSATTAAPRR